MHYSWRRIFGVLFKNSILNFGWVETQVGLESVENRISGFLLLIEQIECNNVSANHRLKNLPLYSSPGGAQPCLGALAPTRLSTF